MHNAAISLPLAADRVTVDMILGAVTFDVDASTVPRGVPVLVPVLDAGGNIMALAEPG